MAVDSSGNPITAIDFENGSERNYLGQNQPNPGKEQIAIPYLLRSDVKWAQLEIRELATGRTLLSIPLSTDENLIHVQVGILPSGMYTYHLLANGELAQTRKLVIVK